MPMPLRVALLSVVALLFACSSKQSPPPKCIASVPPPVPALSAVCAGDKCNWDVLFPSGTYPLTTEDCRLPVVQNPDSPFYPTKALMQCVEGHVWVAIFLSRDGVTTSAKIVQSSNEVFDKSTLLEARQLIFEPMECQSERYDSVVLKVWSYRVEPEFRD